MFGYIILIAFFWFLQSALGFYQIKNFNLHYRELSGMGQVVIGRIRGRLRPGAVVILAINGKGDILESRKMEGFSVFARVKAVQGLKDRNINYLTEDSLDEMKKLNRLTKKCVLDAINNYHVISNGGQVKLKKNFLFDSVLGRFFKNSEQRG